MLLHGLYILHLLVAILSSELQQQEPVIIVDVAYVEVNPAVEIQQVGRTVVEALAERGFTVLPAAFATELPDTPVMTLEFITIESVTIAQIDIEQTVFVAPSSLLEPIASEPISIQISNDQELSDVVVSIAHYVANQCDAITSDEPVLTFYFANCNVQAGDLESAISLYESILATNPAHPAVLKNLAWVYVQAGDTEAAFTQMDVLLKNQIQNDTAYVASTSVAYLQHAGAIRALGFDFDTAIAYLTEAISIAEEHNLPNELTASLYRQRGDHIFLIYEWDRVLADYNRAIELNPEDEDAYFARGILYYTQGPRPLALEDFMRFTEIAPEDTRTPQAMDYIASIEAELAALDGDDVAPFTPGD